MIKKYGFIEYSHMLSDVCKDFPGGEVKIGSTSCTVCKHFVSVDRESYTVECSFGEQEIVPDAEATNAVYQIIATPEQLEKVKEICPVMGRYMTVSVQSNGNEKVSAYIEHQCEVEPVDKYRSQQVENASGILVYTGKVEQLQRCILCNNGDWVELKDDEDSL